MKDACNRVVGNLTYQQNDYFRRKINFLYEAIPDGPAKAFADQYCEHVLRTKGDVDPAFMAMTEEQEAYMDKFWEYVSWWKE